MLWLVLGRVKDLHWAEDVMKSKWPANVAPVCAAVFVVCGEIVDLFVGDD